MTTTESTPERKLPEALGLKVPVPEAKRGGNTLGAIPWETIIHSKEHKGDPGLEFIFDGKSKASGRAAAVKRRFREVDPLANIKTEVRLVEESVIKRLKYDTATQWWGVWVTYLGDLTQAERDALDAKAAARAASRSANTDEDDDAVAVAAAAE